MPDGDWILYGVTGYTGRRIAEEAVRRGLRPVLAGRNADKVPQIAQQLGLSYQVFILDAPATLRQSIRGARLVLNCAGPFSATAPPLIAACLAERVHYLDITGEIDVIESAAALDQQAKAAGVTLLPAVGFDVVPSDCLAARLVRALPDASRLLLAFRGPSSLSPGTAKTMLEAASRGGRVRIDGRIVRVPLAWKTREIPFRGGSRMAVTIPWGDVASAFYSTGIGDIEVYAAASPRQIARLRRWHWLLPVMASGPLRAVANWSIDRLLRGPVPAPAPVHDMASLWGRVENREGRQVEATLTTPEGYTLTVMTALAAVERLLQDSPPAGFLTPSLAFGADFITTFAGCNFHFAPAET